MARPFSSIDAKRVIEWHQNIIEKLNGAVSCEEKYRKKVKHASDALVAQKVLKVLADIPIEEVNRDKKGIRVKALRDYGYKTMADISAASISSIASVHGISEDAAYTIKRIVNDIVSKARQGVKISLSTDSRSKEETELVLALSQYRRSRNVADKCRKLLNKNKRTIDYAVEDLNPSPGSLRWFLSSKAKKQKATEAYNILVNLIDSEYGSEAEEQISKNYAEARRVSWNVDDLKDSSKASRLLELVEEAESENRKVIVFSFFLDTIHKVTMLLRNRCTNPINGSVTPQRRQEIIDEFDNAPAGTVLVAQIQSGGTGLNIQSASVVILCEPQFKPSIENQAISRAYRMGQTRNVLVYRLLCERTVDEKIMSILESKQATFDAFADKSVAAAKSQEMDDKTFGNIIKEEIDRINAKYDKVSEIDTTIQDNMEEYDNVER